MGFEGLYEVSNTGQVRSLDREMETDVSKQWFKVKKAKRFKKGKQLKQQLNKRGYLAVMLYKNKKNLLRRVHQLVAKAFIPNPKDKGCVNHLDCNKTNNNVSNLEWCTYKENLDHARDNGLIKDPWNKGKPITRINEHRCVVCESVVLRSEAELKRSKSKKVFCSRSCVGKHNASSNKERSVIKILEEKINENS